jgi:hypothetical protein
MSEVFETIKKSAHIAKNEAEKITKQVMEKSSSTLSQIKLKYAVKENELKIEELMIELGTHVYNEFKAGADLEGEPSDLCSQVDELKDEIRELRQKIAELKDCNFCTECGEANPKENKFCANCGNSLDK